MDDRRNYYRVLHLQPDAPTALVRVNYRTLMQKLGAHPDLGGEDWRAAHLNDAYQTLSDPERRAEYDLELLSQWGLEAIARGRAKAPARGEPTPRRGNENRRNYYRILQCQHDAPFEVLEASHRALRAQGLENSALLDEALAMVGHDSLREIYDGLLDACGHAAAVERMRRELGDPSSGYDPLITAYCAFCKTPHAERSEPDARCGECRSPLAPPPSQLATLPRRALPRDGRDDSLRLFVEWPSEGLPGRTVDLSPSGMRVSSGAPLEINDVVKVEAEAFEAVGSIAHRTVEAGEETVGLRFRTVLFALARGNFRKIRA